MFFYPIVWSWPASHGGALAQICLRPFLPKSTTILDHTLLRIRATNRIQNRWRRSHDSALRTRLLLSIILKDLDAENSHFSDFISEVEAYSRSAWMVIKSLLKKKLQIPPLLVNAPSNPPISKRPKLLPILFRHNALKSFSSRVRTKSPSHFRLSCIYCTQLQIYSCTVRWLLPSAWRTDRAPVWITSVTRFWKYFQRI